MAPNNKLMSTLWIPATFLRIFLEFTKKPRYFCNRLLNFLVNKIIVSHNLFVLSINKNGLNSVPSKVKLKRHQNAMNQNWPISLNCPKNCQPKFILERIINTTRSESYGLLSHMIFRDKLFYFTPNLQRKTTLDR